MIPGDQGGGGWGTKLVNTWYRPGASLTDPVATVPVTRQDQVFVQSHPNVRKKRDVRMGHPVIN